MDELERNHIHWCFFIKIRPLLEELEREEANKQYHLMTLAQFRISDEIENLKVEELQIHDNLRRFSHRDEVIKYKMQEINNIAKYNLGKTDPSLPKHEHRTSLETDRKRCQKRLMKKEKMHIEYIKQVQEELLSAKKSGGMTQFGTQELNNLIGSMEQQIQHGNMNRAAERKLFNEIRIVKETRETYSVQEPDPPRYWDFRDVRSKQSTDWKRSMQHRINIRLDDIEVLKKAQMGQKFKTTRLKAKLELVRKTIGRLQKELKDVSTKRIEAYKRAHKFGDQTEEPKSLYVEYQSVIAYAKELAQIGDVKELEQLCNTQVEEFMRQWNESKAFQDEYKRRKSGIRVAFQLDNL